MSLGSHLCTISCEHESGDMPKPNAIVGSRPRFTEFLHNAPLNVPMLHTMTVEEAREVLSGIGYRSDWTTAQLRDATPADKIAAVVAALTAIALAECSASETSARPPQRSNLPPYGFDGDVARQPSASWAVVGRPASD